MGETVESEAGSRTPFRAMPLMTPRCAAPVCRAAGRCFCRRTARGGGGIRPFPAAYGTPGPAPLRPTA